MRRKLLAYAILAGASVPLAACGSGGSGAGTAGTGGGGGFTTGGSGGSGAQSSGGGAGQAGAGGVGGVGSGGSSSNGWTAEFVSSELWKNGYSDCEINGFGVESFALDPNKPNRMAAVMTCVKNSDKSQVLLDFDLDTKQLLAKELLLDDAFLGITVTKTGRAAAVYRSQALAANPRVTVAYHDLGAADWQVVTRDYSPFDGYANSMATDGERVMLAGQGAIYDISKLDTPSSWTRHAHDIPGPSAGGEDIAWMVIDAGQATQALLATAPSSELAVYRCTLPTTPAGEVVCQSKPTNQGFASAPYFQWTDVYSHGFATVWARSTNKPTPWATSNEGKTFSDLTLPSPCLEAATTRRFAGDPKSVKTFVIAQQGSAGANRLFATHDSGASYVEIPTKSSGAIVGIAIGSDGSLVLTNGGEVLRRSSF